MFFVDTQLIDDSVWDLPTARYASNELFEKFCDYKLSVRDIYDNRFINIKILELVQLLIGKNTCSYPVSDMAIKHALRSLGLVLTRKNDLFVPNYHPELEKIFNCRNWNSTLGLLKGSKVSKQAKRIESKAYRGLLIPLIHFNSKNHQINTQLNLD
jgi:hypothetical protein